MSQNKSAKVNTLNKYLKEKVSIVFERMMVEILGQTPDDVIEWSINWLNTKGRQIVDAQQHSLKTSSSQDKEDSSDNDEDDYFEVLPMTLKNKGSIAPRKSVSAECYGSFNTKKAFEPRVIVKEAIQNDKITLRLMQSFMFSALDDKDRNIVINAMEQKNFRKGDWVIKQGEDGDELYVVDQGSLDCYRKFSPDAQDTYLKTYQPGESFGELSLLYNAPRAASIQAKEDSICFALDRDTFNNIVKESTLKKREQYQSVVQKMDLFKDLNPDQIVQLIDSFVPQIIKKGEKIIKQGEEGNKFYIVEEGSLMATKNLPNGKQEQVFQFNLGDYFGEIALIKNVPRQANIIAVTDGKLVHVERCGFNRLFGSMKDKFEKNLSKYTISNV